jgi:D-3-phosphoglycerate dehydrogenase
MARTAAIVGTRYPDFSIEEAVFAPIGVEIISGAGATPGELIELVDSADVVLVGSLPDFTAEVIGNIRCPAIVRSGIGVDNIDLDAARAASKWVVNVPDYGTEAVAQHTLALALAATRRLVEAHRLTTAGDWGFASLRPLQLPGSMTAGVLGFGRIGRRVADLLGAVGFGRVLASDPFVDDAGAGVQLVEMTELLAESDVVCLHAPGPADGSALIGDGEFALMRPDSVLVNTARGSLVDPQALAGALRKGAPRIAALDVFSPEPPDLTPYADVIDRMILTPHMAWYTEESQTDLRHKSAEEARRLLEGEPPLNPIVTPQETA